MAQVRKFQSGGKTFKINGKTYNTSNSEDMKRLEEMASNSEYGGIAQQILANVNDAAYDNTLNVYRTSDGRVMMDGGLQHIADQYMSQGTQRATQRKDNVFNNTFKRRSGKEWINGLDSFMTDWDSKSSSNSSTSSNSDGKIKISGVSGLGGQWKYNDQGWDEADINNAAMLKEWQLLEDYYNDSLTLSKEDLDKKYDISGLDKRSLEAYINMRKTTPDLYSRYIDSFKPDAAVLDNDDFYSTYGWFGFTQNPDAKKANDAKALKEYLATQGLDFEGAENVFYRDKDGNLMVTDAFLTNVLGGDRNGHYWLNDNWANLKTDNGNTNPYSQMRDHIIWNGRIYKQDDAAVLAELQKSGYIDANKAYDAARAEQIMRTQWSDNPTFAHEAYDPETRYSEWAHSYKDKGLRYRTLESNLGKGRNLVGYYTNDDPTDNYGLRTERFAIIGDDGKLIQDNVDPSTIAKTTNGQYIPGTTYFMTERLGQDAGTLAGTYIDGTSIDGKPSNTFFYKNPTTGEFFIQDPDLKGNQKGKAVRIPKEIAAMIPDEAWEYFRTNKAAKDRLFKIIRDFTNTGFGKFMRNFHPFGWTENAREDLLRRDFRKAGLSRDQADQIVDLFNKWGRNSYYKKQTGKYDTSSTARQQAFLADPQTEEIVQPFKDGGKIEKHQYGKVLGQQGKTELKTINLKESDRKDASTGQSWGLGSKDSKQWSSLDTMELAGAAADLAALGITIVDPTNIGGAIAGAAGSLTNFGVDVKRDGFQAKDLGKLALNLVLDAGTLIPILGDGLQGQKAIRAMKKAAPILAKAIKTGAIVGVGDAVYNTIDKIAKGESFTISDVRRIINGIQGGITLSRSGLLNQTKGKKTTKFENIEIKGNGIKGLTLTEAEIKSLQGIKDPEKLKDAIVNMWKSQNKKSKLSKAKILEKLDLSEILSTSKRPQWKFWKGFNEVEKINLPSAKGYRPELTTEQLDNISKKRNGFQNWFWGTGKHRNWLGQVEGDEFLSHYIRTPEGKAHHVRKIAPTNPNPKDYQLLQHANPRAVYRLNPWTMPNVVSTQQFPQEMEFTENVSTIPMKRLVFKKGGVLKGQKGLLDLAKEVTSGIDVTKIGQPRYEIGESGITNANLNIAEMARRGPTQEVETPVITKPIIATDYARDHAYGTGNETKATKQVGDYWSRRRTTEQFGGRPTKDSNFEWSYLAKEMAGIGNSLAARMDAKKFLDLSNQKADIYSKGQPSIWNGRGRMRFQTPTMNLVNQQIAANNTIAGMMNTADAQANIAGKLSLAETNSKLFNQGLGMVSQELTNQLNAYNTQRREDDKLTFETANNARQWAMNTGMLRNAGQTEYVTNMGAIRDKDFVKIQSDINRFGMIDAQKQTMIDKLNLQRNTPGLSANQIASIDAQIAQIKSPEYNDILRRQAMYGSVASAKKGTKLRSTTEQMLLDNNKIVAKAISKLNDNTMKLILKAMS